MPIPCIFKYMFIQCKDVCTMWFCKEQSFAKFHVTGVRNGGSQ